LQQIILVLSFLVSGLLGIYPRIGANDHRDSEEEASRRGGAECMTVHVPFYNENCVVSELLYPIIAIDYPGDKLEVIVVDDLTDDSPLRTCTGY
jgi:cellulose synthase/poly-beta-1,6-N-acetylglucosamine synthase-like glycosyltransferase